MNTAALILHNLQSQANPRQADILKRFFKTGPGEYGHGDQFLGLKVPMVRAVVKDFRDLPVHEIKVLISSPWHEARLAGLILLVEKMHRAERVSHQPDTLRKQVFELYLWAMEANRINNWDLVDVSAEHVIGAYLYVHAPGKKTLLWSWAQSKNLWTRRIAIMSTFHFIRQGRFNETLDLAEILLTDPEDLIHKAAGWMLREVGKRNFPVEEAFLAKHAQAMPRTMLRYAIEKFPEAKRQTYLRGTKSPQKPNVKKSTRSNQNK